MRIINLTSNPIQPEKSCLESESHVHVIELLTFNKLPTMRDIFARAQALAHIAIMENAEAALIEGPAFLLYSLEQALFQRAVQPLYSFNGQIDCYVRASEKSYTRTFVRY
jgi:hypothetical protein